MEVIFFVMQGQGDLQWFHISAQLILASRPIMHFLYKTFPGTIDKIFYCAKFHSSSCLVSWLPKIRYCSLANWESTFFSQNLALLNIIFTVHKLYSWLTHPKQLCCMSDMSLVSLTGFWCPWQRENNQTDLCETTRCSSPLHLVSHPFPPNLQGINNPKPLELGSWQFEIIFPPSCVTCQVSCVIWQVSHVRCHMSGVIFSSSSFGQSGGASCWRVCYQWRLPCLVFGCIDKFSQRYWYIHFKWHMLHHGQPCFWIIDNIRRVFT